MTVSSVAFVKLFQHVAVSMQREIQPGDMNVDVLSPDIMKTPWALSAIQLLLLYSSYREG